MYELTCAKTIILIISGVMAGLSKTAVPGLGMVSIPLVAMVFPAKASTGIILPLLIFADIFAVLFYKREAMWGYLVKLMPWAFLGIVGGYFLLDKINDKQLKYFIGFIVLFMLAINYLKEKKLIDKVEHLVLGKWWYSALLGLIAGASTMMANAAGPIFAVYLITMQIPKNKFIGTAAWYFFILNWVKVPFSVNLGFINKESIKLAFYLLPAVTFGAVGGFYLLKKTPEKTFNNIVKILTAAAAIKLLL